VVQLLDIVAACRVVVVVVLVVDRAIQVIETCPNLKYFLVPALFSYFL